MQKTLRDHLHLSIGWGFWKRREDLCLSLQGHCCQGLYPTTQATGQPNRVRRLDESEAYPMLGCIRDVEHFVMLHVLSSTEYRYIYILYMIKRCINFLKAFIIPPRLGACDDHHSDNDGSIDITGNMCVAHATDKTSTSLDRKTRPSQPSTLQFKTWKPRRLGKEQLSGTLSQRMRYGD